MKTIKNLLILIIPVLMFACKQPVKKNIEFIPEEMKPYIEFTVGSYWVYEDSATLKLDSFYLKEIRLDTIPRPDGPIDGTATDYYEKLHQQFYNKNSYNETAVSSIRIGYSISLQ